MVVVTIHLPGVALHAGTSRLHRLLRGIMQAHLPALDINGR